MIYAIDSNKKHSIASLAEAVRLHDSGYKIVHADAEGWIEWSGSECPLPPNQLCEATLRTGSHSERPKRTAGEWAWDHILSSSDIIAYRPILEPQPAQWRGPQDGLPPVGVVCEAEDAEMGWVRGTVIAHDDDESVAVLKTACGYQGFSNTRPIRTERERWIESVMDIYRANTSVSVPDAMGDIYDALKSGELPRP